MEELIDDISQVQSTIAPHVERYRVSQEDGKRPDAISFLAAQTSVALTELSSIVHSHQQTKGIHPELDEETFIQAENAIDTIRHTQTKLLQRTQVIPRCNSVDMGLASAYQKGQSWLLSACPGTDHADALLWQLTNQKTLRVGPGVSGEIRPNASRQLWPPTARTMRQTREYLNPPKNWFGKRTVEFEDCTHTLGGLKEVHRQLAVEKLKRGVMNEWERDIIGRAIERSGGTVPAMNTGLETCDASVAEEEGLYALESDDDDEEGEVVYLRSSGLDELREVHKETRLRDPTSEGTWHTANWDSRHRCQCDNFGNVPV
jgi:hypothetical protein